MMAEWWDTLLRWAGIAAIWLACVWGLDRFKRWYYRVVMRAMPPRPDESTLAAHISEWWREMWAGRRR